jgi:hypothetical protein
MLCYQWHYLGKMINLPTVNIFTFLLFRGWIHVSGVQCNDQAHHTSSENKPVSGNYSSSEVINCTSWHRLLIINTYTACTDNFILLLYSMVILLKMTYFLRCSRFNDQLAIHCQFKHGSWHWINLCPRELDNVVIGNDDDTAKPGTLAKLATQRPRLWIAARICQNCQYLGRYPSDHIYTILNMNVSPATRKIYDTLCQ